MLFAVDVFQNLLFMIFFLEYHFYSKGQICWIQIKGDIFNVRKYSEFDAQFFFVYIDLQGMLVLCNYSIHPIINQQIRS